MSTVQNSHIITDNLVLSLDAANPKSFISGSLTWYDLTSNNINGTLTNGPTFSTASNGAIVFNGTTHYIALGTPSQLIGLQVPLTICGWVNSTSSNKTAAIYSAYKLTGGSVDIYSTLRSDATTIRYYASTTSGLGSYQVQGSLTIAINSWNFVAITVSGSLSSPTVTMYVNATSQSFAYSAMYATPNLTTTLRIGGDEALPNSEGFQGSIAYVNVYNRALTSSEITQNYNASKSRFGITS